MPDEIQETLMLRLFEEEGGDNTVDADVLVQVLQGLQKAVHLLGMQAMDYDLHKGKRIPLDIKKKFPVHCSLPQTGSYALPVQIGDIKADLFPEAIHKVAAALKNGLAAVANKDTASLRSAIPSTDYRRPVTEAMRSILPKAGSTWRIGIMRNEEDRELVLDSSHRAAARSLVSSRESEKITQTVTGNLHKMDFAERQIIIQHPVTEKELRCTYDESLEIDLVESRRELIQVTGTVVIGSDGEIKKLIDVENITPLDLSDFTLRSVTFADSRLHFKTPLVLTPELSESKQLICLCSSDLGIDVFAHTRDELLSELNAQIAVLWREYAQEDDDKLTESALKLKQQLLAAIEEVSA